VKTFNMIWVLLFSLALRAEVLPIQEIFEPESTQYDSTRFAKVAVVQWGPPGSAPVPPTADGVAQWNSRNRATLTAYIREAASKGARLIVTSEFAMVGYPDWPEVPPEEDNFRSREEITPFAETVPGDTINYFSELAKELGVYLHIGLAEKAGDKLYNTVAVLGPDGELVGKFHKINLYTHEHDFLDAGGEPFIYENKFFGRVGIVICADIYSSVPMDYYNGKIDVLTLSTSWAQYNTGMNSFIAGARRTNAYVLAANQQWFPDSGVINPDGTVQSHIRQSIGIAYGYTPLIAPASSEQNCATKLSRKKPSRRK
jgi:predicted amidohydrolase